jgi:nucleotide-binding universal stress UspA family protein
MTYKIVIGVDGSEKGNAALRWAVDEAVVHQGEITAVFAWQMPFIGIPGAFDRVELEELSKKFLQETIAMAIPDEPVPITKLVAEGDVSESLLVASKGADLLVLGSRGRGGFAGLKLGSVSQECVTHAECPVVIIKQPKGD